MQKWYDIVYTIDLVGKNDLQKIKKSILIRTGKRENPLDTIKSYNEIKEYTQKQGYNNPMDYIINSFHGKYSGIIKLGNRCLNPNNEEKTNNKYEGQDTQKEQNNTILKDTSFNNTTTNNDLGENYNIEKERVISKDIIEKPEKIKEETETKETDIIYIPVEIKNRIIKNKKAMKYYREMGIKEREFDNKYDYILTKHRKDEYGEFFQDNRNYLNKFPLIGKMFNDIDLEFRRIMDEIYNRDKKTDKNKNQWVKEIEILTEYFKNKLNIGEENELVVKRLGVVVANLMKKLQFKIFETEDVEITRLLLNFKMQLGVFYSHYRK